jgi:hypothetical protein
LVKQWAASDAGSTAFQPFSPFTHWAVQLRYNETPEPPQLERPVCNAEVAALIRHVEELIND